MLSITPASSPEKREAKFIYMQDNDAKTDKRSVRLPIICALAIVTERNDDKRPIMALAFIE